MDKPIIGLSPMDGVTDASFRFITATYGKPDVVFTEFVNVESIFFAPHTLIKDLTYSKSERPVVAQIYGHTPELFYKVAHILCELGFDGMDINMGCPARKVAAKGSGAALILKPELARSIIQAAVRGINDWSEGQTLSDLRIEPSFILKITTLNRRSARSAPQRRRIPVSVKTRIGYDKIVIDEWIRALLAEELSVISVHGRTLKQGYKGDADWEAIGRAVAVAKDSGILILGNGDLRDMADVYRRVRETNVDGVLLGRAVQGNPWIFRIKDQVKQALSANGSIDGSAASISFEERFRVMLEHSNHFEKHWGSQSFVGIRKHLAWYCHGLPGAAQLRSRLVRVNRVDDVVECLKDYATMVDSNDKPSTAATHTVCVPPLASLGPLAP